MKSSRTYVNYPGGRGVRRIARQMDVSPAYISTVLARALRKIATQTLEKTGQPTTPQRVDAVAFSPALWEILEEILCKPTP